MRMTASSLILQGPQTLVKKSGGGVMALFGLPFFAAGCLVMATSLGLMPATNPDEGPGPGGALFALPFILVGLGFMLGRAGAIIDLQMGTVVTWWGLLVPFSRKSFQLDLFTKVTLKREVRGSGKSRKTVFAVRLEADQTPDKVELSAPASDRQGRADAELLAKFTGKPLADYTSGAPVVRPADKLDESVRDQVRRAGERIELPPAPYNMRTQISAGMGGEVILNVPGPGFNPLRFLIMIPSLFFALIVGLGMLPGFLAQENMDLATKIIIGSVIGFFFILLPNLITLGIALGKSQGAAVITASSASLRVEQKKFIGKNIIEIPANELEELTLADPGGLLAQAPAANNPFMTDQGGNSGTMRMKDGQPVPGFVMSLFNMFAKAGITARSDRATVTFGQGLLAEELKYIHAVIKEAVSR